MMCGTPWSRFIHSTRGSVRACSVTISSRSSSQSSSSSASSCCSPRISQPVDGSTRAGTAAKEVLLAKSLRVSIVAVGVQIVSAKRRVMVVIRDSEQPVHVGSGVRIE